MTVQCPHCGKVLDKKWLKKIGASLMGRAGGQAKARSGAKAAAQARWAKRGLDK
jgi:hypothetical protein